MKHLAYRVWLRRESLLRANRSHAPHEVRSKCLDLSSFYIAAFVQGKLFALPMGYPAMTLGDSQVHGYLLTFSNPRILNELDVLEDYHSDRQTPENLYNRQIIEVYQPRSLSLGWAWVYLMSLEQVEQLAGFLQPDGWWSNCGLTSK